MILVSRLYFGFLGALILCVSMISQAFAVPLENALDKGQAKNDLGMHRPWDEAPPVYYDLNPHMTDGYNEPHPLPAYINRDTYNQLLNIEPVNQVQSRVFNPKLFEALQRIGILGFENKTFAPFEDKSAGVVVSQQAYQELKVNKNYSNIVSPQMMEDARLKIVKTPGKTSAPKQDNLNNNNQLRKELVATDAVDAIMVGAVTKYSDRYRDRRGKIQKSVASGLEFTAFLVDPRTQEVIWGARFVGSQKPGLRNLSSSKGRWLSKEGFSRAAMKFVLKEFRNRD
ncbi:MAG: hypothetical protein HOK41_01900 [Nitrospina sp.]|nr:hypothetical protein [Nitrospina sp.]MBT6718175.1 hypothetical protein [Nitrospina sp.]